MSRTPSLDKHDPILAKLIAEEAERQRTGLELIASENFTSRSVLECLGSILTNKYAEGEVGARYYAGSDVVDQVESLAKERTLAAFGLNPDDWGVNVQPYSGSPANFAALGALIGPHGRLMGLSLPDGGHLTHGFATPAKRVSATSLYFESMQYHVDKTTGLIDYEELEQMATRFRPGVIIVGGSAYSRDYDYQRVADLCHKALRRSGTLLMVDMAHTAGFIASGLLRNPFDFADVVTTTTHKSLRGPRSALIFFRKRLSLSGADGSLTYKPTDLEDRINQAVFPGLQGGPHMHQIAGVATQMREVATPEFHAYCRDVISCTHQLASSLQERGHTIVSGGTDNHLFLWDLRPHGVTGSKFEKLLEQVAVTLNKNAVPGDVSVLAPGGVRIGLNAVVTRGFKPVHVPLLSDLLHDSLMLAKKIQTRSGPKLAAFLVECASAAVSEEIKELKVRVQSLATQFPLPGVTD